MTDNRRVNDVEAKPVLTIDDFYGDEVLFRCGYSNDNKTMQTRLLRQRQLADEGRGPLAELRADLAAWGYVAAYSPKREE